MFLRILSRVDTTKIIAETANPFEKFSRVRSKNILFARLENERYSFVKKKIKQKKNILENNHRKF